MALPSIRIGCGAGFAGDRIDPAIELVESGNLDFLVFECLAERTIAMAQLRRADDPDSGYDLLLRERIGAVLDQSVRGNVRIITNMGAANPVAAAGQIALLAQERGHFGLKIAAVVGDDVTVLTSSSAVATEEGRTTSEMGSALVSANAYLGSAEIARALDEGAHVVITGRVGDPALFVGAMRHAFGWAEDDWHLLGCGTAIGHMLECAGQLTGGYFADPGFKDVEGLARLGFPIAEVTPDGIATFSKVAGSGGEITVRTCTEQLLYEIFDPETYEQPDVTADFSDVTFIATDAGVRMTGASGRARPDRLKASIGYRDGFIGEGQISYAGPGALERGRLALEIVRQRLDLRSLPIEELRLEVIGVDAVNFTAGAPETPREVRIRAAGRARDRLSAAAVGAEVEALYTNGPAGGGGAWSAVREVVAITSARIDREHIDAGLVWMTS
ncbi:acyclic terpene utilization AtuA family protein [Novosphingobium sp. BL-52-GroH]|uniref:acyclic terpene utilization AtuA family protein n=1 Tax=Novosphingobium sp. BL-52-GroH TaxID=3349877 RepID=UPI00384CCA6C